MWGSVVLGTAAAVLVALVCYVRWCHSFWRRRGVPFVAPMFLLGNFGEMMMRTRALPYIMQDVYREIQGRGGRFGGVYQLLRPALMVTDPELIREVAVKYFDHFEDRRPLATKKSDAVFSRSLLVLRGEEWREMRRLLSPAFTGSKLRGMADLMADSGRQFTRFLAARSDPEAPMEMREAFRRFVADVIATTAYGTPFDSINDPDNEFFKFANHVLNMKGLRGLVLAGYIISPKLMEVLGVPLIPDTMRDYFFNLILGSIKYREEQNVTRPDMIQLLMDARKEKAKSEGGEHSSTPSDLDIVSQAVTFFVAGFESVSTTVSFAALELAAHPAVQARLRDELDAAVAAGGAIDYDVIQGLAYLDMVVSEVLRLYPGVPMTDRLCTKRFELPSEGLTLEPGTTVILPLFALHRDPRFFPDPDRFDPERFSEANKHNIRPFTYLPFGAGPRNCIGLRFAVLEMKLCLAHVLSAFELDVCARTQLPVRFSPLAPLIAPEGDFWLTVRPRANPSLVVDLSH